MLPLMITILFSLNTVSFCVIEQKFHTGVLCDLERRLKIGCSKRLEKDSTLNSCVLKCSLEASCVGASVVDRVCFHHDACAEISGCSPTELAHRYMSKNCAHGGEWNPASRTCTCVSGWIGESCLDLPVECLDLRAHGYSPGNHDIYLSPSQTDPIPVKCYFTTAGWSSVHVLINKGGMSFNRTWQEYTKGFRVANADYWIGLENWRALSVVGYTILVLTLSFGNSYREYSGFVVHDKSRRFSFEFDFTQEHFRNFVEPVHLSDCFGPFQNTPFSAIGMDEDSAVRQDCASRLGSGWWYADDCNAPCNILGKFPSDWLDTPREQRIRVDGVDPEVMQQKQKFTLMIYVRRT